MPWFKVDDSFYDHPKWRSIDARIKPHAVMAWVFAGAYSARHLTNGRVSKQQVRALLACSKKAADRTIDALCVAGLWSEDATSIQFRNWEQYQPTRQTVETEREKGRQRRAASRARHAGTTAGQQAGVTAVSGRPDPTRPDQLLKPAAADPRLLTRTPPAAQAPSAAAALAKALDPGAEARGALRGAYAREFERRYGSQPSDTSADTSEAESALIYRAKVTDRNVRELAAASIRHWFETRSSAWKTRPRFAWMLRDIGDVLADAKEHSALDSQHESDAPDVLGMIVGGVS